MNEIILSDAHSRPDLFRWNGGLGEEQVLAWARERGWSLPADLIAIWVATGGGDLFESETILGPFGDPTTADDVDSVNLAERAQGLPDEYVVFHVGLGGFSAVRLGDLRYVQLDEKHRKGETYASLQSWYLTALRAEYADRYGLLATPPEKAR